MIITQQNQVRPDALAYWKQVLLYIFMYYFWLIACVYTLIHKNELE